MKADKSTDEMEGNDLCKISFLIKAELMISERNRWKMSELFITLAQWPRNSATEQDTAEVSVAQAMVPIWKNLSRYNTVQARDLQTLWRMPETNVVLVNITVLVGNQLWETAAK